MILDFYFYEGFGLRSDYRDDPEDDMSLYNGIRELMITPYQLPLHKQIKLKRIHDGLSQVSLGKIVRLPASTISLIENGQRLIMKNRWNEFESYLYEMWFQDGELIDMRSTEREYSAEEIEAHRSRLKSS